MKSQKNHVSIDISLAFFSLVGLAVISNRRYNNQQRRAAQLEQGFNNDGEYPGTISVEEISSVDEYDRCFAIKFTHYKELSTISSKGYAAQSPTFNCFGHDWKLRLHPSGSNKSSEGMISVFIRPLSTGKVTLDYRFVMRDQSGGVFDANASASVIFTGSSKGLNNWLRSEQVLEECIDIDGSLTIEFQMRSFPPQYASVLHAGTCPSSGFEMFKVTIPNFENTTSTSRGIFIDGPKFNAFGHEWKFKLYPGGYDSQATKGMMSALLTTIGSDTSITLDHKYLVRDNEGHLFDSRQNVGNVFTANDAGIVVCNYIRHEQILSSSGRILVNGALVIELHMRVSGKQHTAVLPKNPFKGNMQKLCLEDTPNVSFEVTGAEGNSTFHAHHSVLELYAPMLADLCDVSNSGTTTTIPITDVEPDFFCWVLHYIYGGKVPDKELREHAKAFIHAANKYDVSGLKLEAEAALVENEELTIDNVMETFLFADSKDLALLKETAMNFIYKNANAMLESNSFNGSKGLDPIILKELLSVLATKDTQRCGSHPDSMSVNTLRDKLLEKGLDIDGSREALVSRLQEEMN